MDRDFRYIAPFWNQSVSKATKVEIRPNVSYFLTPVKIKKATSNFFKVQPLIYFCRRRR